MRVNVETRLISSVTVDAEDSNDRYAYRGVTTEEYEITHIYRHDSGRFDIPVGLSFAYVVYCVYTTGDTFGSEEGQIHIVDVVADKQHAKLLRDAVSEHIQSNNMRRMKFHDEEYYLGGIMGYFERVEEVSYELKYIAQD